MEEVFDHTRLDSDDPRRRIGEESIGSRKDWYTARWGERSEVIEVESGNGEVIRVELPEQPPLEEMINYAVRHDPWQCVFRRTALPQLLSKWPKPLRDAYIRREWHRRKNGVWVIVKDRPMYITGAAYTFFNYWHTNSGTLPTFRMEAVEFFWVWMQVLRDPVLLGLLILKPRRIGETEKALFTQWEMCSRVRGSWGGQQNKTDTEAGINFARLVKSASRMPFFFRPIIDGNTLPKKKLRYFFPTKYTSRKSLQQEDGSTDDFTVDFSTRELGSTMDYRAGKPEQYDGQLLYNYFGDEFGKWQQMNCNQTHDIVKYCVTINVTKVVGKMLYTSTVENFENAETLENAQEFWEGANPSNLDSRGSTSNGLMRWFRSARKNAEVDHWGYHRSDELEAFLREKRQQLVAAGLFDDYVSLCRKQPLDIEDVWTLDAAESILNPGILDARKAELIAGENAFGQDIPVRPQRYTLNWVNGVFGGEVEAIVDKEGKWTISRMPIVPNAREQVGSLWGPGSKHLYANGCDPIDHHKGDKGSDYAMAVFSKLNLRIDSDVRLDEEKRVLPTEVGKLTTDQFVCIYSARPLDPRECYEDSLKTGIFYGCETLFENQKPGAGNWMVFENQGRFRHYAAAKTDQERIHSSSTASPSPGQASSSRVIQDYVSALLHHITHRHQVLYLIELIRDFRKFNNKTRTKCDLTVAAGYALMLAYDNLTEIVAERKSRWENIDFVSYSQQGQRSIQSDAPVRVNPLGGRSEEEGVAAQPDGERQGQRRSVAEYPHEDYTTYV